ncbi:oleate delta-12 desaturase [Aspergillus ellipticus CBS 707.79]|uniref:Oleate delta-12 desaturase n=1 Tax=Aspergillus ellipticus CBS 707.79 TaxID=1448320 RepID=A0A319DAV6_9EURO|nr:oleate delta-12 desaturase [Aspergillus ellipticus CBS 707.79]
MGSFPCKAGSSRSTQFQPVSSIQENSSIKELKAAIPDSCFRPSLPESLAYLTRDVVYATILVYAALRIQYLETIPLRLVAWMVYGFCQGLVGTGAWVLAHECGHGAFSPYQWLNETIGWALHSILLVPYFSWKITHARHHRYTGHMEKDTVFVPTTEEQYASMRGIDISTLKEAGQDAPLITLLTLVVHQLVGWQVYIFSYATGGKSTARGEVTEKDAPNLFNPYGLLFTREQQWQVVVSDISVLLMGGLLLHIGSTVGTANVLLLYFMPYVWVHHWIVAITCMHHTHPSIPHYSANAWTFTKGALGTVDRSFGFIGRHFFHDIIDHHVIHHLFPRIPFYRAEEATRAIQPLLGSAYKEDKSQGFYLSLWKTFRECRYVRDTGESGEGVLEWR